MNERHVSVTRTDSSGRVSHSEVHVTQTVHADGTVETRTTRITTEGFDPSVCDAREQALIRAMRAYLRPQAAPERLIARLHDVLDRCCDDDECAGESEHSPSSTAATASA